MKPMTSFATMNGRFIRHSVVAMFAITIARCSVAQETAGWTGAKITKTDLLKGETNHGKSAYFFASVMTREGCHVAKVEGERDKEVFVRRDGQRGQTYVDITHPVFSSDGSALAYAVRGVAGSRFIINEQEGPKFDLVLPDTFVFSNDGKRHAYLAKKAWNLVAVVDGALQPDAGGGLAAWNVKPAFSPDGSKAAYVARNRESGKLCVVVNGKASDLHDGLDERFLTFSTDSTRFAYAANEGTKWLRVVDGKRGPGFVGLGIDFVFSSDGKRTAYTGRNGQQWFLVVDGKVEAKIEGIVDGTLTFSPDGKRLACAVAKPDRSAYILVDGKSGPVHDGIGGSMPPGVAPNRASMQTVYALGSGTSVLFSPDSRRIAYLAHSGRMKRVYVDGKADEIEMDSLVGGMVFSDDSKRLAYEGRQGNNFFLVVDGKKGTDYDALGYFGFSPDGNHIAFTAKKGGQMVIVVDGQERGEYDAVPAGPVFRSDGVLEFLAADKSSLTELK